MATPAEVMSSQAFTAYETDPRERAIASFRITRRRNRTRGMLDTVADAVMATGGLIAANAGLHFGLGLPEGRNGLALGGALLASGMVWISRHVRGGGRLNDPAGSASRPVLIWSDEESVRGAAA
ncbi:MAG: hypothetical protein LC750_16865 [Actinobacteria bacterium]|nr:hypothetical protein [Actinomycetota bacterium]